MVLGINLQETPERVKAYMTNHRLTFPHVLDADARVGMLLGVPGTPTTILVNRTGQLIGIAVGYRDWSTPTVQRLMESMLKATP